MKFIRNTVLSAAILSLSCLWGCSSSDSEAPKDDSGYFLSWQQKAELLWDGQMKDAAGNTYDVWICPGYAPTARFAARHWEKGADDFMEYFKGRKYRNAWHNTSDVLETAWDDVFYEWTVKGVRRAWVENFSSASNRVEKRVFGWLFAYPIAFCQSTMDNVFRIPAGLCATSILSAGSSFVPVGYGLNSGLEGGAEWIFPGTLAPICAWTWNSIAVPPMSLIGQRPAPGRVDGFWVVMKPRIYSDEEISTIAKYLSKLGSEVKEMSEEESALTKERAEAERKLVEEFEPKAVAIRKKHEAKIAALREELAKSADEKDKNRFSVENVRENRETIKAELIRAGLSETDAIYVLNYYTNKSNPIDIRHMNQLHSKVKPSPPDPVGKSMNGIRQEKD